MKKKLKVYSWRVAALVLFMTTHIPFGVALTLHYGLKAIEHGASKLNEVFECGFDATFESVPEWYTYPLEYISDKIAKA